ncbi:MAG: hypothetical protein JNK82_01425 [Myxococcaceae bacterium]|nr:hypothetical protein [Myxococcaceae bacterium]
MPTKVHGANAAGRPGGAEATDALFARGFDTLAKGGTVQSAIGAVLGHLISDAKTRKAVEPQLKKLFDGAEGALKQSKTAEAGLKALRETAASPELKSRIGRELQSALGDKLGGSLGGHIGAVLAAFAKGGLGAAVASTAAHAGDVKGLIDGAGGMAKVVESLAEKVPVVGLADSVAKHGKTAATGTSSERWVGFATIAANIIAAVAPSWGATAMKAADAVKAQAARSDKFGEKKPPQTGTDTPVASETAPPQASDDNLFGGAVKPKAQTPVAAIGLRQVPPGAEVLVAKTVALLKSKFSDPAKFSPAEAEHHATRLVANAIEIVYGKSPKDLTNKHVQEHVMMQLELGALDAALEWAGRPTQFKPAQVEPFAKNVDPSGLVQWYANQGIPETVVRQQMERLRFIVNGAVPVVMLNANEGELLAVFDAWKRGEKLPEPLPDGGSDALSQAMLSQSLMSQSMRRTMGMAGMIVPPITPTYTPPDPDDRDK